MHWCVSLHWSTHRGACTLMHSDAFSLLNLKLNYVYDIYVVVHCLIHFTLWCPRTLYTDSHCKLCFGTGLYFILWIVWHLCYTLSRFILWHLSQYCTLCHGTHLRCPTSPDPSWGIIIIICNKPPSNIYFLCVTMYISIYIHIYIHMYILEVRGPPGPDF